MKDQAHARNYPGRKAPSAEKVRDASHDQAALNAGRSNSLGASADGSHKGLPAKKGGRSSSADQGGDQKHARNYPGRAYPKKG